MDYTDEQLAQIAGVKLHPVENTPSNNFDHISDEQLAKIAGVNLKDTQPKATFKDRASQVGTGLFKGAVTGTAGMLSDTAVNAYNLARMPYGVYQVMRGHPELAPEMITDTKDIPGTSEYLNQKVRNAGGSALVNPAGTMDETGRLLHAGAMGLGGGLSGHAATGATGGLAGLAKAGAYGAGTAAASQGVGDATGSPTLAALTNLAPMAGGLASSSIGNKAKTTIRGSDAEGLPQMRRTLADLRAGGIEQPTVGLATGNKTIQGVENTLPTIPGAVDTATNARARVIEGLKNKAQETANVASNRRGADVAGRMLQTDLTENFPQKSSDVYRGLDDRSMSMIPDGRYPASRSLASLGDSTSINPSAPKTTSGLIQPQIEKIANNLRADTAGTPATPSPIQLENGQPARIIPGSGSVGIDIPALREIRTKVGKNASSKDIIGTPEEGEWKGLYGGLSQDIRNAAKQSDLASGFSPYRGFEGALVNMGPAEQAFSRANNYWSSVKDRQKTVQPLANMVAPEQASRSYLNSANNNGNLSTLRAVKRTISPESRAANTSAWIDELGRAKPGSQNELSDVWSPDTFLTNWNKTKPQARSELLSGFENADQVGKDINAVAKAASLVKESSNMFKNPSGTAASSGLRGALKGSALTSALFAPISTGVAVGSALGISKTAAHVLMDSPKFINWLAEPTRNASVTASSHLQKLAVIANQSKDPEFKKSAKEYMDAVSASQNSQ